MNPLCVGYEQFVDEISVLVSLYPPPFIYINDPISPRVAASVVDYTLENLLGATSGLSAKIRHAKVNAISCFSPRLLYDAVLNALSRWNPSWDNGCTNWNTENEDRWNENFDGFMHGLCALHDQLSKEEGKHSDEVKGKRTEVSGIGAEVRLVILIESAERLKETLPDLVVPLTRLAELTRLDLTVIFISVVRWEDVRPSLGASPDPYFIDVPPLTKQTVAQRLASKYPATKISSNADPYHPSLKTLYSHFISTLCDACGTFTLDSQELEYIAAARWPGFVQPVLDNYWRQTRLEKQNDELFGNEMDEDAPGAITEELHLVPPSEDVRMRLIRLFTPSLSIALEALYPRLTNATDWAIENAPEYDVLAKTLQSVKEPNQKSKRDESGIKSLPRMSKFILVGAFLASTNPAKSDIRMFGRGLDEKKRKRRVTKASVKSKSGAANITQRLVGPVPFPLDRLIAILGALLEENDGEVRLPAPPEYTFPGEYTDMETSRIGIVAAIMELTSMRLLHRTSLSDKIDGPPMFKCGISYHDALALARQLDVPLNDLLWEPV